MTDHNPSRNCYLRGCRLPECERENYVYAKQLKIEHNRGERRRQDVAEVRSHIEQLLANKWWLAEIARVSGVPRSNLQKIVTMSQVTHRDNVRAILAVPVVPILRTPLGDRIHALGSARRLRALAWLGHPWKDVGAIAGMTQDRLSAIACGNVDVIRPEEAPKIAAAFRRLSIKPGRMKQIATAARNKGWHGPLDWDDIDDPACQPEEAAPYEAVPKYERDPDKTREIEHLYLLGESPEQIAKRFDGNEKYIRDQLGAIKRQRAARAEKERAVKAGLGRAA